MLYERWREIARAHANDVAVWEPHCRWRFRDLATAAEKSSVEASVITPQGQTVEFILSVLAGWREGRPVCPLESSQSSQTPPALGGLPARVAHVKFTSATTGSAKSIVFSPEQMQADVDNIVATMGLRREWPNLALISLAHSYGFSNLVLPLLLHGIPLILASPPLPAVLQQAAVLAPEVTLAAVPALWQAWHEARAIPANVRLAISAGAPLLCDLEAAVFKSVGLKIRTFYGASECGGIAYDATPTPRDDASYIGAPLRNVELRVNADGCLEVRSHAVGMRYWPEADDRLGEGVFRTSDLAEINDGVVYLRGRASDLINVAGRKVAPERIERELLRHPALRDCLVLGVPDADPARGEAVAAVVVTRKPVSEEALRAFLLDHLQPWQLPRMWRFVDDLPRNERGKISRAEWRKAFARI
jgi:long-chain acyl-CoA synthetase